VRKWSPCPIFRSRTDRRPVSSGWRCTRQSNAPVVRSGTSSRVVAMPKPSHSARSPSAGSRRRTRFYRFRPLCRGRWRCRRNMLPVLKFRGYTCRRAQSLSVSSSNNYGSRRAILEKWIARLDPNSLPGVSRSRACEGSAHHAARFVGTAPCNAVCITLENTYSEWTLLVLRENRQSYFDSLTIVAGLAAVGTRQTRSRASQRRASGTKRATARRVAALAN
jgi:hypothetical protein